MKVITLLLFLVLLGLSPTIFAQEAVLEESMQRGSALYKSKCAVCHKKDGTGRGKNFPPLALSDFLMNNREASIRGIKFGFDEPLTVNGKVYKKAMAAVALSGEEIADVMNFVSNSWGNTSDKVVTLEEVEAVLEK